MRIGIDFDNTIVCYDDVFYQAALKHHLIPAGVGKSKGSVRDFLRRTGKEASWTELQGHVYGAHMDLAHPFPGVEDFFKGNRHHQLFIISHKTLRPFRGPPYDLHDAARSWLGSHSFFDDIAAYFELTLQEKLGRIQSLQCDLFIDDLPELLTEPAFPPNIAKILFDPHSLAPKDSRYQKAASWEGIERLVRKFHE